MERKPKPSASDISNPFLSHIPKYQHQYSSPPTNYIPTTITQQTAAPSSSTPPPHHNIIDQQHFPSLNKYEPNYTSNIPIYHNNQQQQQQQQYHTQQYQPPPSPLANSPKNQFMFNHTTNTRNTSSPPPVQSSAAPNVYIDRGTGSSGYGNQNVYSNQMYGRTITQSNHQKLPPTTQQQQQQPNKDCNDAKHILNGNSGVDALRGEDQGIPHIFLSILFIKDNIYN